MPKNTEVFAIAPLLRLLKKGSGMRVSETAAKTMQIHIEERTRRVSHQAVILSQHAARSTVLEKDIRLALEKEK